MNYSGCLTLLATPVLRPVCTGGKCGLCPLHHDHDPPPPPGSDQSLQWEALCRQHPHHWRPQSWGYFRWNPVSIPLGIHLKREHFLSLYYWSRSLIGLGLGWLISLNRYNKYSVSVPDLIKFIPDPVLVPLKRLIMNQPFDITSPDQMKRKTQKFLSSEIKRKLGVNDRIYCDETPTLILANVSIVFSN